MVNMIISAVLGAVIILVALTSIFGIKFVRNKRLSKLSNITLEEQKSEALIKAVKALAKHSGLEYSKDILALNDFELDQDQLQTLILNARAEKGKVGNDKILKKASKVKF